MDQGVAITASNDETARIWEVASGHCKGVLEGHTQAVRDVQVDFENKAAVTCSDDMTVRMWELETYSCTSILENEHLGRINIIRVRFDREPQMMVSASTDYTLRLWNLETKECEELLCSHSGKVISLIM